MEQKAPVQVAPSPATPLETSVGQVDSSHQESVNKHKKAVLLIAICLVVVVGIGGYVYVKAKQTRPHLFSFLKVATPTPIPVAQYDELNWQNLSVSFPEGAISESSRLSLSNMGFLSTNKFTSIDTYQLAVYPPENTDFNTVLLTKPAKLTYRLNNTQFQQFIKDCELDPTTISFFTNPVSDKESGGSAVDAVEKLDSKINNATNTLEADLGHLGKYQQYGIFTDIVVGANPSKYLLGCGSTAEAYLEGDTLVYKQEGYRFKLPTIFERPIVSNGLVNNRIHLLVKDVKNINFQVISMDNWQKLGVKNLDKLQYPGYEMAPAAPVFGDETITLNRTIKLAGKDYLEVGSMNANIETYRLITTFNKGTKIFMVEFSVDTSDGSIILDTYKLAAQTIAASLEDL